MIINKETILIVDDHTVVLHGLELMINEIKPQASISTALSSEQVLQHIDDQFLFDWIFIDVNLPGLNGIELLDQLRRREIMSNIIMLSSELSLERVEEMLALNINGVLSKDFDKDTFSQCFKTVEQGLVFMPPELKKNLTFYRQGVLREKRIIEESMNKRQADILLLIANGCSNHEIAKQQGLSVSTVKTHIGYLLQIFNAKNRTHCIIEAQRLKII